MAMRKRSGSGSKRHLKEKVVQIYESFFRGEDLPTDTSKFWDEFFLLKPKIPQLQAEIQKLTIEQLNSMTGNMNLLITQCIQTIGQEHHIRVVYALQTLNALIMSMYRRTSQDTNLDLLNITVGRQNSEQTMKTLLDFCNQILIGEEKTDSLKSTVLKLLLSICTGYDRIDDNILLEYLMSTSLFEAFMKLLSSTTERSQHGYDVVVLLMILVNYKKNESINPYIVKLSILDDELALNGYSQVITQWLSSKVNEVLIASTVNNQSSGGWFSSLTSLVGSVFLSDDNVTLNTNNVGWECMLLALYCGIKLNHNLVTSLAAHAPPSPPTTLLNNQSPPTADQLQDLESDQPTNLLVKFLQYCSIVMADIKSESNMHRCLLCFIILTCITEEQFINTIMHDQNITFKVQLYHQPMRHRKVERGLSRSRPLACVLIEVCVEFMMCHLLKKFPFEAYGLCVGVVRRVVGWCVRVKVRGERDWRSLWSALFALTRTLGARDQQFLSAGHPLFALATEVINIFNMFITYGDSFLPTPATYDQLYYEIIRNDQVFDNLFHMALRYSTCDGPHKAEALRLANSLVNIRAILQHFTPKIATWLASQNLSTPTEDQILDVVRKNYDSLILKLQEWPEWQEKYNEKQHSSVLKAVMKSAIQAATPQS